MRLRFAFYILSLILYQSSALAQAKFWISNDELPMITTALPEPDICSEWLDQCSYNLDSIDIQYLSQSGITLDRVDQFAPTKATYSLPTLGFALEQVEAGAFLRKNLTGKGVKIGVIDGGFLKADEDESLRHFFTNNQVKYYKDYVTPDMESYGGSSALDDNHGTEVWQAIGGFNFRKNIQYGLATEATYYLARTDHGAYEKRVEEDYLIKALEDMARMKVKLINISLGYNLGFNNPKENYKASQMDGKTSAIARAVDHAALKKGMLIIVAAGNEGADRWQTLSTPGDARHALTVGSSKLEIWDKMNYSSIGPDYTDFVKPDISIYSAMGTSYSTPIVTGMAACIWQLDSTLTNFEIMDIFRQAANYYPFPNNYLGYGVPTCPNILKVMAGQINNIPVEIHTSKDLVKIDLQESKNYIVAYHKKDARNVESRVVYRPAGLKVKVKKIENCERTTVLLGKEVIEVFWE